MIKLNIRSLITQYRTKSIPHSEDLLLSKLESNLEQEIPQIPPTPPKRPCIK